MRDVIALDGGAPLAPAVFDSIVKGPHEVVVYGDVLDGDDVVLSGVQVESGTVTYDRNAAHYARVSGLRLFSDDPPLDASSPLSPAGYQIRLYRGVRTAGSGRQVVALGTFAIQDSKTGGINRSTELTGIDRSKVITDARVEDVYQDSGNVATIVEELIADAYPGTLTYNFPSSTFTSPSFLLDPQADRWKSAAKIWRSAGFELFFDGLGVLTARAEPSFDDDPVFSIGYADNLIDYMITLKRDPAFNKVIAVSASATAGDQYRGEALDNNPSSPSYYYGRFGRKPRFYASPFIGSNAQAEAAAESILASALGIVKSVQLFTLPNPRIEPADVITVALDETGTTETYIIDSMDLTLGPEGDVTLGVRAATSGAA